MGVVDSLSPRLRVDVLTTTLELYLLVVKIFDVQGGKLLLVDQPCAWVAFIRAVLFLDHVDLLKSLAKARERLLIVIVWLR